MADERDPKVSRRYRDLGGEEPSRELDQTILAAAHRAADRAHAPLVTPAGRHRWYFAFGAAAILVLAVAVTVHVERERPDAEAIVLNEQVPPQAAPASEAPPASEAAPAKEPPRAAARVEPRKQASRAKRYGPAPDPARKTEEPPPQAVPDAAVSAPQRAESAVQPRAAGELARSERLEAQQQQTPRVEAQSAPAPAPSQPESREQAPAADAIRQEGLFANHVQGRVRGAAPLTEPARAAPAPQPKPMGQAAAAAVPLTPERLLERIVELRKEGRHKEADQALAEFRERYPDYRISEEMLQKVERKK